MMNRRIAASIFLCLCTVLGSQAAEAPFSFDFEQPQCTGIARIQFISRDWLLVINDATEATREKVLAKIRQDAVDGPMLTKLETSPDWTNFKKFQKLYWQEWAKTYDLPEETAKTGFFAIQSADDPQYKTALPPAEVLAWHQNVGVLEVRHYMYDKARRFPDHPRLAAYSYLHLPHGLVEGARYEIVQADGGRVAFRWSEDRCVSVAIRVNQSGYVAGAGGNEAQIGLWLPGRGPLEPDGLTTRPAQLIDAASGRVLREVMPELRERLPKAQKIAKDGKENTAERTVVDAGDLSGESLYVVPLGDFSNAGDCYLKVPGVGRSWPFRCAPDGYGRAFYYAMRGMYHQRCGIALDAAQTAWPRGACHIQAGECALIPAVDYNRKVINELAKEFDVVRNTGKFPAAAPVTGRGGWHDAADFDRRWYHYGAVWDLLFAFEFAPENFTDNQLNLPESGNGVPDILDEAAYGLLAWRNTQRADGGVSGRIEQVSHPNVSAWPSPGMPDQDPQRMFVGAPTPEFSYRYAAAAAQLARLLRPFAQEAAAEWLATAEAAWRWAKDPANRIDLADYAGTGKPYREPDEWQYRSQCLAGLELFYANGNRDCLADGLAHVDYTLKTNGHPNTDLIVLLPYAMDKTGAVPAAVRDKVRGWYLAKADMHLQATREQPYRFGLPRTWGWGYAWGQGTMTNHARWLLIGHLLSGRKDYYDAAAQNADFTLGLNPMGISWLTGCGYTYPVVFMDVESEDDGILDPVPGLLPYGVVGGVAMTAKTNGYFLADRNGRDYTIVRSYLPQGFADMDSLGGIPIFHRWTPGVGMDPAIQEFTIWETMSPSCFTYALLMGKGWKPSAALTSLQPRPAAQLYGLYYTP